MRYAVPSRGLGAIEGGIGDADERLRFYFTEVPERRHPYAEGQGNYTFWSFYGLVVDASADGFGKASGNSRIASGEHRHELVSTVSSEGIIGSHRRTQTA